MNDMVAFSDLQLVEAVTLTRADALAEIYRRHSVSVAATARMVLGDASACDDVVAEVFLALWLKPRQFDPERGSLLGFLRMKARGRSIDIVRSEGARHHREKGEAFAHEQDERGPEQEFLTTEAAEHMRKAIDSLAESERAPIDLAFFTGMSYKDVAKQLGLPEGTVKSRIRKGLHQVRVLYEGQMRADADDGKALQLRQVRR